MGVRREDLQRLSEIRFKEAETLLVAMRYSGAYYLAGYCIEFGLKACASRQFRSEEIPDKKLVDRLHTHVLTDLISLAGLATELREEQDRDQIFQAFWGIISEWRTEARYDFKDSVSANLMLRAVGDKDHGVLRWIRTHW
jgi:hypothetical protein